MVEVGALHLRLKDIYEQAATIMVLHGKRDKRRIVGLDSEAMALISTWIDRRRGLQAPARATLFCTLGGGVLYPS
jgi:site-specific recombinase XerD